MDPDQIKAAIEAIKNQDDAAALQILEAMIISAAGGGDAGSTPPPPDGAASESADPVPPKPGTPPVPPAKATLSKDQKDLEVLRMQVQALTAEQAEADLEARQELVAELVKLGVETPATAWADAAKRTPAKRFNAESVKELRARVVLHRAAAPKTREIEPPTSGDDTAAAVARLTAAQLKACKDKGMTPEQFVQRLASAVKRVP